MDTTAETPTKAAGIFKLGKPLFLHTAAGPCVTFVAGCAAIFTAFSTQDAGLAAACAALAPPALIGGLLSPNDTTSRGFNAVVFAVALAFATVIGGKAAHKNELRERAHATLQSLPEMRPDTRLTVTAKDHYCGSQTGWIKVQGQKLNCGN